MSCLNIFPNHNGLYSLRGQFDELRNTTLYIFATNISPNRMYLAQLANNYTTPEK